MTTMTGASDTGPPKEASRNRGDEAELLQRFRRNQPGAFDALYAAYGARVFRFCLRLCNNNTADAEDLTQEAFVGAYQGRERFAGRATIATYLYRIALYQWRAGRERARVRPATVGLDEALHEHATAAASSASDPAVVGVERVGLASALGALPDHLCAAFLLTKVEGMTGREAAAVLGLPVGTVKFHVYQATRRLQALLCTQDLDNASADTPPSGNLSLASAPVTTLCQGDPR